MTREIMEKLMHAMEEQDHLNKIHLKSIEVLHLVAKDQGKQLRVLQKRVEELEARERSMVE